MAEPLFPMVAPAAEVPRVGLLATFRPDTVEDREVGFTFNPEGCGESGTGDPDPCNTDHDKDVPDNPALVEVHPIYAWAGDKCAPWELDRDWQGRARRQLAATLSYQAARELWTGAQAEAQGTPNRALAGTEQDDVVTDEPTSPTDAIARLEQAYGECVKGGRAVIHVTLHAATFLYQLGVIRRDGNLLLTALDSLVVADAGYDGSGPFGQAATDGSVWAYATGGIIVRVGPERTVPDGSLRTGQAVNRATNMVEYRAERKLAVGWDGCCHFAAEMQLGWRDVGGAGS